MPNACTVLYAYSLAVIKAFYSNKVKSKVEFIRIPGKHGIEGSEKTDKSDHLKMKPLHLMIA